METERRKAVLWVKDFQMEVSLAPVTPAKPAPPAPRPIATDGQETRPSQAHMAESESYLSRCSHQGHQAQRLVSCPVSSVEASNSRSCDGHIGRFASHGDLGLPQSSSEARRTAPFPASDSANFGETTGGFNHQWKEEMSIDRLNCNAGVQRESSDDPLSQYYQFRFRDLLGMNKAALMPSISEMLPGIGGDSNNGFAFDLNSPNEGNRRSLNSGSSAVGDDRHLMQFSQPIGGNYTQQMQQSDVPHDFWSLYNSGTPVSMQASITNGSRSVLAPGTPDHCRRLDDSFPAERTGSQTGQNAKDQDTQQDNQVAATRVDLQELQNNEETAGSEVLPGMVSALMENHNPDKGSNNAIDLNKTPQQKARRKKHRPKVISENKPKRGPKPQNPKPTDPKDTPRAKRKYVRKNKTNPPLTTPPAKATEETDQNVPNHSVKSCRRSLNFNLDPQMKEDSSLNKSNRDPSSETQADNHSASGIQLKEKAHQGKGQEVTVDMRQAGTAYDLCHAINQMLKGYITLPQEEMPITPDLTNTTTSEEKGKAMADSVSTTKGNGHAADSMKGCSRETIFRADCLWAYSVSSSTCGSSNDGEQTTGLKRAFPFTADTADMSSRNLTSTHGAFCSSNDQFLGNGDINRMAKILFPEIYKKKRTEVLNRSNTVCASSSIISEDATEITIDQNCLRETSTGSRYLYCNPPSHLNTSAALNDLAEAAGGSAGNRMSFMHTWTDIEKLKRKRSKGPIRACDVASPTRFAGCKELPTLPGKPAAKLGRRKKVNVSNGPHACTEPPAADPPGDRAAKKRSKKRNSASSSPPMNMQLGLVVYRKHQSAGNSSGTLLALPWEDLMSIDSITTGLQQLDINRESCNLTLIEQKALVPYHASQHVKANFIRGESTLILYGKDGSIVPFRGSSEAVKKRRERAKVDLDDETDRVWKLLLDNINNEGIDGTDEEKAKWWDEERKVFHGRVDSFIARMRLVQGDRRFTPWKGSVVDSVIGVFLTQNVADHLSSSAFMSLAAHFPLKCQDKTQYDETTLLVKELEDSELDHDDVDTCSGKMLDEPVCDRSSRTLQDIDHGEEKEIVNSRELLRSHPYAVSQKDNTSRCINSMESSDKMPNESRVRAAVHIIDIETASTSGDTRIKDDIISSQQSVLSSQTSVTSPSAPAGATIGSGSESNSEAEDLTTSSSPYLDHPTSFMELLKMAEAPRQHEAYIHKSGHRTSCQQNSNNRPEMEQDEEVKGAFGAEFPKSSFKAPNFSKNYQLHLRTDVQVVDEESRSSNDSTRKDDSCTTEQSELTTESTTQSPSNDKISETILKPISSPKNLRSCYIFEGEKMVIHSQGLVRDPPDIANSLVQRQETSMEKDPNFPTGMTVGVMGRTSPFYDKAENHGHNDIDRNSAHDRASGEPCNMVKTNTAKQNKATVGKGTKTESDWDSLRKQAQATGRKREKMANTMDSLDYEAVRCADVSEIADTIRERGMNNRLAERIKDFLNRLVSEHGGIDLEWLREVPPDKAKEYLLSIRGLGLKSVECVRLLTLHHLAFPVDTNVGRIAVRLGWVPLQPLPESLQLHLLELYPVLESIQKYLWPRLCKLDQRTLYELHYHMITFGKVFCTKRQPNCNACPLRGECRHFASAFASARLALPGPEGRSIMASINCGVHHEDPQVNITPFALEAPQANTLSETKPEVTECEPIVEVPASPEPAEQIQTLECDIEDTFCEDPNEIPTIKLNMEQFTQTLQTYMQANKELQPTDMSKALVALTAEAASIPTPKLKNVSRLRTEHHVYELPDTHPLLDGLDKREPGDPCSYLLAIWTPGETANSSQPPERKCNCQEPGELCEDETCFYCNSQREANSQIVRGTLLIPCRTAMRGSFPLNGTYFQVNEVFADHDSSLNPIAVPRDWLWNLPRRTVYFGTSIPTIMRGLSTEGIQHCFWRGYVCVRGFDQKSRAPRPLMARLHLPASKMTKSKGKANAFSSQQDD